MAFAIARAASARSIILLTPVVSPPDASGRLSPVLRSGPRLRVDEAGARLGGLVPMLDTYHISETFGDHRDPTMIVGVCFIQLAAIISQHRPPLGGNVMRTIFVAAILGEADCLPVPDVC